MVNTGRNEHAIAGPNLHFARVEAHHHDALEDDLLVLDVVMAMARNATTGFESELAGNEVRNPSTESKARTTAVGGWLIATSRMRPIVL
jgi:DNA polymerase III epsilon subunit-like protein